MREYSITNTKDLSDIILENKYKLVIWDFDGTLVDTVEDVIICFNKALVKCGFPEQSRDYIKMQIGGDLETIVSALIPEEVCNAQNVNEVKRIYRELYLNDEKIHSTVYPGINELLMKLASHNVAQAINSNKGQILLEDMTYKIFGTDIFGMLVGYEEGRPSKPDRYGVDCIRDKYKVSELETVYIGDGKSDYNTAFNAGVDVVLVKW